MNVSELKLRADLLDSQLFFNLKVQSGRLQDFDRWSSSSNIQLLSKERAKKMERMAFLIDGFDKQQDYYVDFGDGNCKRILARKFHYQFSSTGTFDVVLYLRAGDSMIPISSQKIRVEHVSLAATLRSISLF
jgi:hypothetical protein